MKVIHVMGKAGGGGCGEEEGQNNGRQETGHRKQADLKTCNDWLFLHQENCLKEEE